MSFHLLRFRPSENLAVSVKRFLCLLFLLPYFLVVFFFLFVCLFVCFLFLFFCISKMVICLFLFFVCLFVFISYITKYVIANLSYHELQIYHYFPSTQTHMVCILNNLNQFKLFTIYQTHIVCRACLNRTLMSFSNKVYILFLSPS